MRGAITGFPVEAHYSFVMGAQLRVVLDQIAQIVDPDQARAARDLTAGLIQTAPSGCTVEAIVPAGASCDIAGLASTRVLSLARRELAASWQLGIAPLVGGGLIHAPTLNAPLIKHDRLHNSDQVAVTLWNLDAWEVPHRLSKSTVAWQRGMLRRAVRHADAVVVPTHSMAERLGDIAKLGDRVRVIAGAPPEGFREPRDAAQRRAGLQMPQRYIVIAGGPDDLEHGFRAAAAADIDAVVLDAAPGSEPRLAELASAAGLAERRAHVRGVLDLDDRAAVLGHAAAFLAVTASSAWPWRAMEAMTLRVPVVAADSGTHRDAIAEGGALIAAGSFPDAVTDAVGAGEARLRVLAGDRAKAFSWASSAERVWSLHADL